MIKILPDYKLRLNFRKKTNVYLKVLRRFVIICHISNDGASVWSEASRVMGKTSTNIAYCRPGKGVRNSCNSWLLQLCVYYALPVTACYFFMCNRQVAPILVRG